MPSLLKRRKNTDSGTAPAVGEAAAATTEGAAPMASDGQSGKTGADDMATQVDGSMSATTGMVVPAEPARPAEPPATYDLPGLNNFDIDRPPSFDPAPPPPDPPPYSGSLIERAFGSPDEIPATEKDRIAQAEFEQAIAPVLEMMRAAVPGASTPEEAQRILSENQGEITPDPKGGAYVFGDAFDHDARVYYRLLHRDYEKNPRPAEKRAVSHHLHGVYGKLTGTKGW